MAIGHTRWATHGKPSDENSHPHFNKDETLVVVHNGIIENYLELKKELIAKGYKFNSETDTEVVTHLLDELYEGDLLEATKKLIKIIKGAYALGIMAVNEPDRIIAVRKESPLIIGLGKGENYIASDIPAILKYTRDVYLIENNEIVEVKKDSVKVMDTEGKEIKREVTHVEWDMEAASKGGYEYFMEKEIHEQPEVLIETLNSRVDEDNNINFDNAGLTKEYLEGVNSIYIVACGTAYHAGLVGKFIIEKKTRVKVDVDIASLDYIFINNKSNTQTVSAQAYKECIKDVTNESNSTTEIYDSAKLNARNMVEALIKPFIEQLDSSYKLEIN